MTTPDASIGVAVGDRLAHIIEPMPFGLLDEPLEYIFGEHFRQRISCNLLRPLRRKRTGRKGEADSVAAFLLEDLPLHHADEDEDLFPTVRRRALPQDDLGPVLARLGEDHVRTKSMVDKIVAALTRTPSADPVRFEKADREVMQAYAASEHRHLAIETASFWRSPAFGSHAPISGPSAAE